jgi:hypothetical protein
MKRVEPTIEQSIGDLQQLDAQLDHFWRDASVLSGRRVNLIEAYLKQLFAINKG